MIPRLSLVGAVLVGCVFLQAASAADGGTATALEQRLFDDAADGRLDEFSLFEAALVGSGLSTEAVLRQRVDDFRAIAQQLRAACAGQSAESQVQSIFHFTHQRFLTGPYDAGCSDVQRTLDEGRFNCVTATVLFHSLCEQAGLKPLIVAVPGHVFSRFQAPGVGDVQTTCADWFGAPRERQRDDRFERGGQRIITPVQLLGKFYYNAGIALLESRDYERAVSALEHSTRLDAEDQAARDNLLAAINNWSLSEEEAGRVERASELIERGLKLDPLYGPLLANDLHIHQKRALALCDVGKYADAWALLERCRARRPDVPLFDAGRLAVVAAWSDSLARHGRFQEAFEALDALRAQGCDPQPVIELKETLVRRLVAGLHQAGRPVDAATVTNLAALHRQDAAANAAE